MAAKTSRIVAGAGAALFGALALVCLGFGVLIAAKVFDDYKDSPDSTYLIVGGLALLAAGGLGYTALSLARGRGAVWPGMAIAVFTLTVLFMATTSLVFVPALAAILILGVLIESFGWRR